MSVVRLGRWRIYRPVAWIIVVICGYLVLTSSQNPVETAVERNAHKASLALIAQRRQTDAIARGTDSLLAQNRRLRGRVVALRGDLRDALDSADAVLADSLASVGTLRVTLANVTERARTFADSTDMLLTHLHRMDSAVVAERQAWLAERNNAIQKIAADSILIGVLRKEAQCTILGPLPCPTRRTAFALGTIAPLILLLL